MAPCTEECLETESKCGLGVFNYIRLNSNNLLHILEVFCFFFPDSVRSHVSTRFNLIRAGQCGVSPETTTVSRCSQKRSPAEDDDTIVEPDSGDYHGVSKIGRAHV